MRLEQAVGIAEGAIGMRPGSVGVCPFRGGRQAVECGLVERPATQPGVWW